MFQKEDMVVYGHHGICKIIDKGTLSMDMVDKKKEYYTLNPVYRPDALVYAPVENRKILMRKVIQKEEAEALIDQIPQIETVWILNEKVREAQYKEALQSCDCVELIKIIKTLFLRKKDRMEHGKKVTVVDERYFRQAEERLYGELAFVLGKEKSEMPEYIAERMEEKKK